MQRGEEKVVVTLVVRVMVMVVVVQVTLAPTNIDVPRRGKNDHKLSPALAVSVCRQLVELCKCVGLRRTASRHVGADEAALFHVGAGAKVPREKSGVTSAPLYCRAKLENKRIDVGCFSTRAKKGRMGEKEGEPSSGTNARRTGIFLSYFAERP